MRFGMQVSRSAEHAGGCNSSHIVYTVRVTAGSSEAALVQHHAYVIDAFLLCPEVYRGSPSSCTQLPVDRHYLDLYEQHNLCFPNIKLS